MHAGTEPVAMEKRAVFNSSFRGSVEFQPSLTALFSAYLNPALHRLLRMIAGVCPIQCGRDRAQGLLNVIKGSHSTLPGDYLSAWWGREG